MRARRAASPRIRVIVAERSAASPGWKRSPVSPSTISSGVPPVRVAIMGQGQILQQGKADALVSALGGRVWTTVVTRAEAAELRTRFPVLASRLKTGRIELRVLADDQPTGMTPATPTLEDVYFSTLLAHGMTAHLD